MDKSTRPLNPEALKIALEAEADVSLADVLAKITIELLEVRNEFKKKLQAKAKELRDLAKEGDEQMNLLKKKGVEHIEATEKRHADRIARMRAVMPELQNCEFKFDIEDGTFTPYGPLGAPIPREGDSQKPAEEEASDDTKQMVADLMKRISKKEA